MFVDLALQFTLFRDEIVRRLGLLEFSSLLPLLTNFFIVR